MLHLLTKIHWQAGSLTEAAAKIGGYCAELEIECCACCSPCKAAAKTAGCAPLVSVAALYCLQTA